MEKTLVFNKEGFDALMELEVRPEKYKTRTVRWHYDEDPKVYPCIVISLCMEDPCGPDEYRHEYVYLDDFNPNTPSIG